MYYEVLIDALKDTALLIPVLLVMHLLIEIFEVKSFSKLSGNKVLKGNFAPLIATGVGLLPQCGFSVVASDMYAKKYIRIGTLAAVFIATSDEALPILFGNALTDSTVWIPLLQLMAIKVVMAVLAGYVLNLLFRKREVAAGSAAAESESAYGCCGHAVVGPPAECEQNAAHKHSHGHHGHNHAGGKHESRAAHIWHSYIKHPVYHTIIIALFILAVNFILGSVIFFVGEERLAEFMEAGVWLQPLFAGIIGLIPNCASSVVIAEMFVSGSLTLGAAVSGLAVNCGLGFAVLFKNNKNLKENLLLLAGIFVFAVAAGYLITAI